MIPIRRALISVSDKTGLTDFAGFLNSRHIEIISTGGTARALLDAGIPVIEVSQYTGHPEILDGRVKTLHPRIHAGLLAIRGLDAHEAQMRELNLQAIDMVAVNLYPFEETSARPDASFEEVVEQIDIGGPSMVRSAAKNHASVAVVTHPADYDWIRREMTERDGSLSAATRFVLAQKAFALTARYDAAVAAYLSERVLSSDGRPVRTERGLPALDVIALEKVGDLRYGENPHQRAALYRKAGAQPTGAAGAEFLHGKELSYNNLLDADAAWNLVREFDLPAAAIIKHTNPCGVAQADRLAQAYVLARDCDPVSAFGSVVSLNRRVDEETAAAIHSTFVEVVLAPDYDEAALAVLRQKKNVRLLRAAHAAPAYLQHREIDGGFLVQEKDVYAPAPDQWKVVTARRPTDEEMTALVFGWRVVKHVKSNAIVFCDAGRTLGIGAGQMSRVDAVRWGSQRAVLPLPGCVMASDAFFPF
ncbi:MAG: bifunctional phosphoribosylaminoimidazolecarboxamide formyltransferase/IMP cyclohydrolase, partial [Acidobacteria bacterium]|nr:bifunctional phosphoribosylaminoimidazolecarboxamide formyltransferase/IMP cyclohydrolase [Acidobacteriota bacterium]